MSTISSKICFFRDNAYTNEYFIRIYTEEEAMHKANCFNHRNGMEGSGYPHLECELALALEIPDGLGINRNEFLSYIIKQYGKKTRSSSFLGEYGWYEFADISQTQSWFNDFIAYKTQTRLEAERQSNMGKQIALF